MNFNPSSWIIRKKQLINIKDQLSFMNLYSVLLINQYSSNYCPRYLYFISKLVAWNYMLQPWLETHNMYLYCKLLRYYTHYLGGTRLRQKITILINILMFDNTRTVKSSHVLNSFFYRGSSGLITMFTRVNKGNIFPVFWSLSTDGIKYSCKFYFWFGWHSSAMTSGSPDWPTESAVYLAMASA